MRVRRLPTPESTAALILKQIKDRPCLGIILGSGFGPVAKALSVEQVFSYCDLPGFPPAGASGHAGQLILGHWHGVSIVVLNGRSHYYEGLDPSEVTFPTRVLAALGISLLLITNAAGGINPDFKVGDFMVLRDHINFMGMNPLRGPITLGKSRFVDLTFPYDTTLASHLADAAKEMNLAIHRGVYLAVSGPSFETPAEIRAFGALGADAVGMSTVPEVIVGRQCGIRIAGLSCITNAAAGLGGASQLVSAEEVLAVARGNELVATRFIGSFVKRLAHSVLTL
ncbi:MAG: purine-nucleoside phosphorylase [Pedosphaera sp.]|nr:purine-nucleoside phosphorylase [Pedosphaera sp.]